MIYHLKCVDCEVTKAVSQLDSLLPVMKGFLLRPQDPKSGRRGMPAELTEVGQSMDIPVSNLVSSSSAPREYHLRLQTAPSYPLDG